MLCNVIFGIGIWYGNILYTKSQNKCRVEWENVNLSDFFVFVFFMSFDVDKLICLWNERFFFYFYLLFVYCLSSDGVFIWNFHFIFSTVSLYLNKTNNNKISHLFWFNIFKYKIEKKNREKVTSRTHIKSK